MLKNFEERENEYKPDLSHLPEKKRNRFKYAVQLALLDQLKLEGLITEIEYKKVNQFMIKKYKIDPLDNPFNPFPIATDK
ncbi:MAG: hypothetical protein PWQ37_2682 [Candidatus Petromonas sp.]|jgi:hypothetical protein|nr:hypothetical protein [Candidatus Petromonas sp.]